MKLLFKETVNIYSMNSILEVAKSPTKGVQLVKFCLKWTQCALWVNVLVLIVMDFEIIKDNSVTALTK